MNKVVHFEIPVDDLERARNFYQTVFGWETKDWELPGGMVYTGVRTVPVDEKTMLPTEPGAINGGLVKRSLDVPSPILTLEVDSLDEYVKKVEAAGGGTVSSKGEVAGMGYYIYLEDSEGNVFGLWETIKKPGQ